MRISVLTPTIRPEFLGITQVTLANQTNKDFEWLVEEGDPAKGFTLPTDFNKMLSRAKGDIIVILQDCIEIPKTALEEISQLNHESTAYTYPVGKTQERPPTTDDEEEVVRQKEVAWDWRKHKQGITGASINPDHWEIDFASAPKALFYDVGGFDEDFNNGWSWENVELAYRASLAGYKFEVSNVTEGVAFDHDAHMPHPFRTTLEPNNRRATKSRVMADAGRIKLDYLPLTTPESL